MCIHERVPSKSLAVAIGALLVAVEPAAGQFAEPAPVERDVRVVPAAAEPDTALPVMLSRWVRLPDRLPLRVFDAAVARVGDRIVVAGGFTDHFTATPAIQIHHPRDGWQPIGSQLATPRARHTLSPLPSGRILVVGGLVGVLGETAEPTASCELIDPRVAGTWPVEPLPEPVAGHAAHAMDGERVAIVTETAVHVFDPVSMGWVDRIEARLVRRDAASVRIGPRTLLVIGGDEHGTIETVTLAAGRTVGERWTMTLPAPVCATAAIALDDGTVVVAGGLDVRTGRTSSASWRLGPRHRTVQSGPDLALPRGVMHATLVADGPRVAVLGGEWRDGGARGEANAARLVDTASGRLWSLVDPPESGARRMWLAEADGRVTVIGGYVFVDAESAEQRGIEPGPRLADRMWTLSLGGRVPFVD